MIDSLSGDNFAPRPTGTADSITVLSIPLQDVRDGPISGSVHTEGSYSGFGYNNIQVGFMIPEFTFDEFKWPLTRESILKACRKVGKNWYDEPFNDEMVNDNSFIRINSEFCTIFLNGETYYGYRDFGYWSHIPAISQLMEAFEETSTMPHLAEKFAEVTNLLTSPRFAQYLSIPFLTP